MKTNDVYEKQTNRLVQCGLLSKDRLVINGFRRELARMGLGELELTAAINGLIDTPPTGYDGNPAFVTTSHIKLEIDRARRHEANQAQDNEYQEDRRKWQRDSTGTPDAFKAAMDYLDIEKPTDEDRQKVIDEIRAEAKRHPPGSEVRRLWIDAGMVWQSKHGPKP